MRNSIESPVRAWPLTLTGCQFVIKTVIFSKAYNRIIQIRRSISIFHERTKLASSIPVPRARAAAGDLLEQPPRLNVVIALNAAAPSRRSVRPADVQSCLSNFSFSLSFYHKRLSRETLYNDPLGTKKSAHSKDSIGINIKSRDFPVESPPVTSSLGCRLLLDLAARSSRLTRGRAEVSVDRGLRGAARPRLS
ncbi:hypothetical protein EVAR_89693_1 [Eumeta japonica]|uniref:Uncharacterized protein n=1 Tax=Eumeta variegata TaxID=151549 RepID=A0A4C1X0I3_EUMVA|nr:hypothetical protein EVAR_89693_1 [Eumeta japonica]